MADAFVSAFNQATMFAFQHNAASYGWSEVIVGQEREHAERLEPLRDVLMAGTLVTFELDGWLGSYSIRLAMLDDK
ncbi:hypothetical protein ACCO45_010945 [Purpureocillium lilacinum]|uniref:Uncharacterized protein n=2 Tax=Purpureocillium lilacinum TaxID=33203 RepID=A0ACC4DHR3_PURLI|nr:hypothetical protein Purlil1_6094 [Purpureocillium lilacinum]